MTQTKSHPEQSNSIPQKPTQKLKSEILGEVQSTTRKALQETFESHQGAQSKKLVGAEGIRSAQEFFGLHPFDGKYTQELSRHILEFQKANGLTPDGVIGLDTQLMMERKKSFNIIPGATEINAIFEQTVQSLILKYTQKLNTQEGIDLSYESLYQDVLGVLRDVGNHLKSDAITSVDVELFITHFLQPKDKGVKLVSTFIDRIVKQKPLPQLGDGPIQPQQLDLTYDLFKSSLRFLSDVIQTKTPEQIQLLVNEAMSLKEARAIFDRFPDLNVFLTQVLPKILKYTDEKVFFESLDLFYSHIRPDLLSLTPSNTPDQNQQIRLHILNEFSKFLSSIVNEQQVETILSSLGSFESVHQNPVLSRILSLLDEAKITKQEKLDLTKKLISGLEVVSKQELTDEDLNRYIGELSLLIKDLSGKIPDDKLKEVIRELYGLKGPGADTLSIDVRESIKVVFQSEHALDLTLGVSLELIGHSAHNTGKKFVEYLSQIKDHWATFLGLNASHPLPPQEDESDQTLQSLDDFLLQAIRSGKIEGTISDLGGKVVETLKKVVGIDLRKVIQEERRILLGSDLLKSSSKDTSQQARELASIEKDAVSGLLDDLTSDLKTLVIEKLGNPKNHHLTKDELIELALSHLPTFVSEHTDLMVKYLKVLSVPGIDNPKLINDVVHALVHHPNTKQILSDIIDHLGGKLPGNDLHQQFNTILKDALASHGASLLPESSHEPCIEVLIDTLYGQICLDPANLREVWSHLAPKLPLKVDLSSSDFDQISVLFKKYISKSSLQEFLVNHPELLSQKPQKGQIANLIAQLYAQITDKPGFLQEMSQSGLLDKTAQAIIQRHKTQKSPQRNLHAGVEMLYSTLETSDETDLTTTLDGMLHRYGLHQLKALCLFGNTPGTNIISVLRSLRKEDLESFLYEYSYDFKKLTSGKCSKEERNHLTFLLSCELFKRLDPIALQREYQSLSLPPSQRFFLQHLPIIQDFVAQQTPSIVSLLQQGKDLHDFTNGKIDFREVAHESIKSYGRRLFDLIHDFVGMLDSNDLSGVFPQSNTPSAQDDSSFQTLKDAFQANNLSFLIHEGIAGVFSGFQFNVSKSIVHYFQDPSNRTNFGNTLYDFLVAFQKNNHQSPIGMRSHS